MKQLFVSLIVIIFSVVPAFAGKSDAERDLKDLYFGEALYQAYQEDWFGAISRLDTELAQHYLLDEPQLDSLFQHLATAEFSVGDF